MKILVLSDSHSSMRWMRQFAAYTKPDVIFHLGDHYDDGEALAEEYFQCLFYQVPGNCDTFRAPLSAVNVLNITVSNVRIFATHGHIHHVKSGIGALLSDARKAGAQVVLYGHTHQKDCHQEEDGLWVLNPGSAGNSAGSAGLVEVDNGKVVSCRLLCVDDLEGNI